MVTPTGNEDLQGALSYGESLCWNESIGYNRFNTRYMNPNVDCSSFIWYCLHNNGFNVGNTVWYTTTMLDYLQQYQGFQHFIYDGTQPLVEGDIFIYDEGGGANGHTFFYAENRLGYLSDDWENVTGTTQVLTHCKIEASATHNHPEDGDQDNGHGAHTEVWVHGYNNIVFGNHTWHVFRWTLNPPTQGIKPWLLARIQLERRKNDNGFDYY